MPMPAHLLCGLPLLHHMDPLAAMHILLQHPQLVSSLPLQPLYTFASNLSTGRQPTTGSQVALV